MSDSIKLRNIYNEIDKQTNAINDREIMGIFRTNCAVSRSSFKCDRNCGSKLAGGNIPEAVQQISNYRSYLWLPNNENNHDESSIREHRTALLINDLFQMQDRYGNFDFQIGNGNNKVIIKI